MIRRCEDEDFDQIWRIINDGASAYKGAIPQDCWKEPYMSRAQLQNAIEEGVSFWGYDESGELLGVMGIQHVKDVTLIRHAYVRTSQQGKGVGSRLLTHLMRLTQRPILIGTWADATWAIRFYLNHGFLATDSLEKDQLLRTYWKISQRQIDTSVVLVDVAWREHRKQLT